MITETRKKAVLTAPETGATAELIELINTRVKPNRPLEEADVIIRSMHLVSDQINSFGGRFDQKELAKMAELVIDGPVLVGHNHQRLPIARNFKAEVVEKNGAAWLVTNFYWLAEAEGAQNLLKNIDAGIYKEVSAAFLFELPECSVCGQDIRACEHIPFRRYAAPNGTLQPAFFWYRNVSKVLETSLVYRGAVPGTKITAPLADSESFDRAQGNESTPKDVDSLQNQEVFTTKIAERKIVRPRRRERQRIYAR